ncbi:hypothetical protein EZS27_008087 [termite gut metagenome]|uniref:Putative zinc ribbon domain-containing protein n=1 Tax=termite gut metagenome TaxID=433724 RepID=A0A5J4SG39_9ZZZZ
MEQQLCQSCGMPVSDISLAGTNVDGSKSEDYCVYCFADGCFTSDCTMDEMIEKCLGFLGEFNKDSEIKLTIEEARIQMKAFFPQLKRWKE